LREGDNKKAQRMKDQRTVAVTNRRAGLEDHKRKRYPRIEGRPRLCGKKKAGKAGRKKIGKADERKHDRDTQTGGRNRVKEKTARRIKNSTL